METAHRDMSSGIKESVLAIDISTLLSSVNRWSMRGFQRFIESGTLSDIIEAAKNNRYGIVDFQEQKMTDHVQSSLMGTVTMGQLKRLLEPLPIDDMDTWKRFVTAFQIWSVPASWWDENIPSPEIRDKWRKEMRLVPFSLHFEKEGKVLSLRRPNKNILFYGPSSNYGCPEGHRFATTEEFEWFGCEGVDRPIVLKKDDDVGSLSSGVFSPFTPDQRLRGDYEYYFAVVKE